MRRSEQATSGSGAAADSYTHRGTCAQEYKSFITNVSKEIITTRFGFNTYHVLPSLCDFVTWPRLGLLGFVQLKMKTGGLIGYLFVSIV
jgi:hypothetical protein